MKISDKLYRLRTENHLTQVEFGKIAGVSNKAVSTWEQDKKEPRMKSLHKICTHFGIDLNQFVDPDNDVYKKENSIPVIEDGISREDILETRLRQCLSQLTSDQKELLLAQLQTLLGKVGK